MLLRVLGSARLARLLASLAVAAGVALSVPAIANALRLGTVAPPDLGGCSSCSVFQVTTAPGERSYKVPKGRWQVTSWSAQGGGTADGEARLLVFRRTAAPGQYKLTGKSRLETVPADGSPNFATNVGVRRGDRLGISTIASVPAGYSTANASDLEAIVGGSCDPFAVGERVGAGTTCPLVESPSTRANVSARLQPR